MAEEEKKSLEPAEGSAEEPAENPTEGSAAVQAHASGHDSHGHGDDAHGHGQEGPVDSGKPIPEKNWQDSFLSILAVVVLGGFLYIGQVWSKIEPMKEVEEPKPPEVVLPKLLPPALNPKFKDNPMNEKPEPTPNSPLAP